MRVKANNIYVYNPNGLDIYFPLKGNNLKAGTKVKVVNLHGCPKANTMGQCYVIPAGDKDNQNFCMVSTTSLEPVDLS